MASNSKGDINIKISTALNKEGFKQLFAETNKAKSKLDKQFSESSSTKLSKLFGSEGKGIDVLKDQKAQKQYFDSIYKGLDTVSKKVDGSSKISSLFNNKGKGIDIAKDQQSQKTYFDSLYNSKKSVDKQLAELDIDQTIKTIAKETKLKKKQLSDDIRLKSKEIKTKQSLENKALNEHKKLDSKKKQFPSWALSLLFAGQALQRAAISLMTWGTKAYDDVSHSVIGTITANDRLQGSMLYLGYVVGEALAPILEWLVPIIESISEWVSENQELVKDLAVVAAILGTIMMYGAMFKLFVAGLKGFADALTLVTGMGLPEIFTLTLSSPFLLALAAAVAIFASFNKLFNESPAFKEDFIATYLTPFKTAWDNITGAFKNAFKEGGALNDSLDFLGGIIVIVTRMGLGVFVPALLTVFNTLALLVDIIALVAEGIKYMFTGDIGGIQDTLDTMRDTATDIVDSWTKGLADADNAISNIATGDISLSAQAAKYNKEHPVYSNAGTSNKDTKLDNYGYDTSSTKQSTIFYGANITVSNDSAIGSTVKGYITG